MQAAAKRAEVGREKKKDHPDQVKRRDDQNARYVKEEEGVPEEALRFYKEWEEKFLEE